MIPHMLKKNLQFVVKDGGEGAALTVNYEELCSSLIALLENAMQASPVGGRISLTCDLTTDEVFFTVADQGNGIDIANEERLFEPFFTTRPEGTGLGLAIVHSAIKQMGGDVQVKLLSDRGSEFILRLPRTSLSNITNSNLSSSI